MLIMKLFQEQRFHSAKKRKASDALWWRCWLLVLPICYLGYIAFTSLKLPRSKHQVKDSYFPDISTDELTRSNRMRWLLFRAIRSGILQSERALSKDLELVDLQADVHVEDYACPHEQVSQADTLCNISMRTILRKLTSSDQLEVASFESTARPRQMDAEFCKATLSAGGTLASMQDESMEVFIDCKGLDSRTGFPFVVVVSAHVPIFDAAMASWIESASLRTEAFPFLLRILIIGSVSDLASIEDVIRIQVAKGSICVFISFVQAHATERLDRMKTLACSPATSEEPRLSFELAVTDVGRECVNMHQHTSENRYKSGYLASQNCEIVTSLKVAGGMISGDPSYQYVLWLDARFAICPSSLPKLMQSILSLRRDFSAIRCGPGVSCLVFQGKDLLYWAEHVERSVQLTADETIFHHAQGLNVETLKFFGDARFFVTKETLVYSLSSEIESSATSGRGPYRIECGTPMTKEHFQDAAHDEDMYLEETGCVPSIDYFSPCLDQNRMIHFLERPHWMHWQAMRQRSAARALAVQVLSKDRPLALFRTVSKLVEQTDPKCITIHVDAVDDNLLRRDQRSTLRVAQWFSRMFGVRWRRNTKIFHTTFVRATGFRRNFAEMKHGSSEMSDVDGLVHLTWNALAYAFNDDQHFSHCVENSTVILEDDLLPTHDMMHFFRYGYDMMMHDSKVKVVSAWNDNSFNLRRGLECSVQRGEHFMGMGWLTTRAVYNELIAARRFWPVEEHDHNGSGQQPATAVLSIKGGWEMPFLKLFDEQGFGIFPLISRVIRQAISPNYLEQFEYGATPKYTNQLCTFPDVYELEYDRNLTGAVASGHWIDFDSEACFRNILLAEDGQTYIVAVKDTDYGWSLDFTKYLLPLSWIRGYLKVRGSYKDILLLHVAQHLLMIIGPRSIMLRENAALQDKFQRYAMTARQAAQFFDEDCGETLIYGDDAATGSKAVELHLAKAGQSCDAFCNSISRVCRVWGAIYSNIGLKVRHGNVSLSVVRPEAKESEPHFIPFGRMMQHGNWKELPVLRRGIIEAGLVRLFRCDVITNEISRRVCPCLNISFAHQQEGRGLF